MVDFSVLQLNTAQPVYLQLANHVRRAVASGKAKAGEALPSRREIAALLGVNPNTVQKAFALMEEEGIISTPRNAASVITADEKMTEEIRRELEDAFAREFVHAAQENGLSYKRTIELVSRYWGDV